MKKVFLFLLSVTWMNLAATHYYVDCSVPVSGNGLSWSTPWKTIASATAHNLLPGDVVWVKSGTYAEPIYVKTSGAQIVPVTTGITASGNTVQFPSTTDLSAIALDLNPGEYFLYLYRSWKSNNGVFKILSVDNNTKTIAVENGGFISETGINEDLFSLSACVGRPVIFKNASENPVQNRVVLDISGTSHCSAGYIGKYINAYDANPVNFVMVDGIDLTGSKNCGGWHIQSSNFNVIMNSRIYNMGTVSLGSAPGILINGNQTRPANYNLIINNDIYNTPHEGVYVGAGGQPQSNNHTHFNHVVGNHIYTSGNAGNAKLENAIDFKEYNFGNVAERNEIGPYVLSTAWNGAIDIVHHAHHILVYNNVLKNITKPSGTSYYYIIGVNDNASNNYIFNNLICNSSPSTGYLYGISVKSTNLTNSYIAHNTIYNLPYGLLLDNSSGNSTTIANNIVHCSNAITNWSGNNLNLKHNLYSVNPTSYTSEVGRLVGNANFADPSGFDFRLSEQSTLALNNSFPLVPAVANDHLGSFRDSSPDRGAFELSVLIPSCEPPISFIATEVTNNSAQIQWSSTADQFAIEFGEAPYSFTGVPSLSGISATTVLLTGLKNETSYQYKVRSICSHGIESAWSASNTFTTKSPVLTVQPNALDFGYVPVGSTALLSFQVAGNWLGASVLEISAPDGFMVSLLPDANFSKFLQIELNTTELNTTTIYVMFTPPSSTVYNGAITNTCGSLRTDVQVQGSSVLTYCTSKGLNSSSDWIQRVQLGSINNTSGNNGGNGDYTYLMADLVRGVPQTIFITPGKSASGRKEAFRVWIDLNQNGVFESNELMVNINKTTASQVSAGITIPTTAKTGTTRMRVSMRYNASPSACEVFDRGEVEDYSVNITSPVISSQSNQLVPQDKGSSIFLYPNPIGNSLFLSRIEDIKRIAIYNSLGKLVYSCSPVWEIPMQNYPPGFYFVRITFSGKPDQTFSIIKK